jgi:exopolysaccharide biosynthesis polyprenyl glycosylphosphotransferase
VARQLRLLLPFGVYLDEPLYFTPWFYLLVSIIWVTVFFALRVYYPARALRYAVDFQLLWGAATMALLVFSGLAYLLFRDLSRYLLFYFYLLDLLLLTVWRMLLPLVFSKLPNFAPSRQVLVVGAGEVGQRVGLLVSEHSWAGLKLVGFVDDDAVKIQSGCLGKPVFGTVEETVEVVNSKAIDEVIVTLPSRAQLKIERLVLALQATSASVRLVPDVFSMVFIRASVEDFAGVPLIGLREPVIEGVDRILKRAFDLCIGGLALLFSTPFMLVIALAIKLDSPGSVLFCQQRVGEGGELFQMLKFRTMVPGAEKQERMLVRESNSGPPIFDKRPDDPRVTRVGCFLRRWSLDELPQLVNVMKGEMSLVGPRPELPWLVEEYEPWQRKRFAVPQGMAGWWQVHGRSNRADYTLRVEDDLYYIRNWSLWLDLRILWMTIGAVIRGEGAY